MATLSFISTEYVLYVETIIYIEPNMPDSFWFEVPLFFITGIAELW